MIRIVTSVGIGAVVAVLGSFPVVAIFALFFRFPVPFAGYEHGMEAVPRAIDASVFYGMVGGYMLLITMGAICGLACSVRARTDRQAWGRTALSAFIGTTLAVAVLSVLDKIIGPW